MMRKNNNNNNKTTNKQTNKQKEQKKNILYSKLIPLTRDVTCFLKA